MGGIGNPRAVGPLIAVLQDRDGRMRRVASEALGGISDPRAVGPLIAVLQDRNGRVRRAGSRALGWSILVLWGRLLLSYEMKIAVYAKRELKLWEGLAILVPWGRS